MARGKKHEKKTAKNGANLGFEQTLWQAALFVSSTTALAIVLAELDLEDSCW